MKNLIPYGIFCMVLFFLILIAPPSSALSVTESPNHVQKGDLITITIKDLQDGSLFSYSIEGQYGTTPGAESTFQTTNFTMPFSLNAGILSARIRGTEWGALSVKKGFTSINFIEETDSDGVFTVSQSYDILKGSYTYMKLQGQARPGVSQMSTQMGLAGTKKGPNDSRITFTLDGIDNGEVTLIVLVDGKEALHKTIMVGNGIIPTQPPVANFSGTPLSGTAPLIVKFTDTSTHFPTSRKWSFGDGSRVNSSKQNPIHTYTKAGTYRVSLNATNAGGSNTSTKMRYITVNPPAPVANFAASQLYGSVPLTVTFTDRSTNSPTTWRWTFGDGSRVNTTRQNPVHTYTDVGTYNVSLKATNAGGSNTVTKKRYIGVLTPYPTLTPTIFPASGKVVL